ncbi:histidine kinase [Echinicola strongylocentroti]|uniref:Oxygen sensor histidine kinase NreB n=1 Tax=Echinicola strongylocentroti TaxID=1795355 RepID=A0A2Z4ILG0_9BACT|nr:ATP-binding protein [Echinicola strongylocentroti]AWW31408.1 histidine kinase [Echinicola strongylocentroti]
MKNHHLSDRPKYGKLVRYYLIALCAIATSIILSQILVQKFISEQKNDSGVVNLSGRQRMLSQEISKYVLLLGDSLNSTKRADYLKGLKSSLEEWKEAHVGLQYGNESLGINGKNSKTIQGLFADIAEDYSVMVAASQDIIKKLEQNLALPTDSLRNDISQVINHEQAFLTGMDKVVFQYDNEAKAKVTNLQSIEIFLLILSLGVISFEIFFIFIPSARTIRKTFKKLLLSEQKSRKMTLEISSLYNSLEQAYQDLLEVDVAVEDYTVFAKSMPSGEFFYFSDNFSRIMEFDSTPKNIFKWLKEQGYNAEYLDNIQKMTLSGKTWTGDIKVVNDMGDFVWIKINIIPTMGDSGDVETLMVVATDETEKKEAEAISQEINRERIEKKVKEQQFRSALILEGQEEERKRISRDMHDGIGQLLSAMKFNLEGIHSVKSDYEREKLKTSKDLLKNVIKEVRRISFNLTPSALSDYGIVAVLNKFCKEITKLSDLQVSFENQTGFLSRLEGKVENNLYRICQEAVNNAIKYAEANEVKITLSHNSQFLNVDISDDGKGFDVDKLEEKGHLSASGHGLFNIRERANFINGQCTISSQKGKGTTISINIPLD